jgi:hypothetical protein
MRVQAPLSTLLGWNLSILRSDKNVGNSHVHHEIALSDDEENHLFFGDFDWPGIGLTVWYKMQKVKASPSYKVPQLENSALKANLEEAEFKSLAGDQQSIEVVRGKILR